MTGIKTARWARTSGWIVAAALIASIIQGVGLWAQSRRSTPWSSYGGNAQHTAVSRVRAQDLSRIHWQTPVDLAPQYSSNDDLLIHYGSPLITAGNTVLLPVKTGPNEGFQVEARNGTAGRLIWMLPSDYTLPPHHWTPVFGPVLSRKSRLYFPGAGGTVYFRDDPDSAGGAPGQFAFYGLDSYRMDPALFNASVIINTPLTADSKGDIYFGFIVSGNVPGGLASGIARISADGHGTWVPVTAASGDPSMTQVVTNCAPALSTDLGTVYAAVSDGMAGYLIALDSTTLRPRAKVRLQDPASRQDARLNDNGSASPTIGPDNDVYFGVLESSFENHGRGWLLHFDAELRTLKTPGAFGWDLTASVIPPAMVPSYRGSSSYLLMTKYNDYRELGGSGLNRIAILDPNATEIDPVTGIPVMKEVLTVASPTPDGPAPAVKEWCINSAAVDPAGSTVLALNEDGKLYRWDLIANKLTQVITLTSGVGQAYTPTVIGVDGTVYAISNATLFAVGE